MAERWHKDPKTGEYYQEWREKGKTIRSYRGGRESSSNRAESSSIRREQPPPRSRRDSIISSGSIDSKPAGRYQAQRGTSSKRETSVRPDDDTRGVERSETTYTSDSRVYARQDDLPAVYADRQTTSSYREGRRETERTYYPSGGFNPQPAYSTTDDLAGGIQSLSIGADYGQEPIATSLPAYAGTTAYGTLNPTPADYGQTPTAQSTLPSKEAAPDRQIRGTPHLGDREKLDKSYKIRNTDYKKFFKIGRVFATLWTEGVGSNVKVDQTFVSEVVYSERVHSKIRRFVVVREGDRSVTCLPVTSYDGDGHKKLGIRLGDHGFIHSKSPPRKVEGMLSKSLKVVLSRGAAHIRDPSLVNYGKVYTVETNVKVKDIGDLDTDSKALLVRYFHQVFLDAGDLDGSPRQSSAVLAHVGGAAYNLTSPSGYNTTPLAPSYPTPSPYSPPTGQYTTSGPPSIYANQDSARYSAVQWSDSSAYKIPTGYTASSDTQQPRAGGEPNYPYQAGTGYSAANVSSDYPSTMVQPPVSRTSVGYNTTPNYYPTESTYPSSDTRYGSSGGPAGGASYGETYSVSYTPRTYPSEQAPSGDYYRQTGGGGQASSSGGDYYASYQTSNNPQTGYYAPAVDDDIRLPTFQEEEARRRRESNAGTSRERDRRRRR